MKTFEVMTEITIAKTLVIQAPDEETAQQTAKANLEALYEKLPKTAYNYSTDELTIEIGDAEEIER